MKTIIVSLLVLTNTTASLFAQGTVLFNNTPSTPISAGFPAVNISGAVGSWYFGLLTSTSGAAGTFTFSGNYATNAPTAAGRFIGGTQIVNGWAPGTTMFYEVAGWSSSLGPTFQPGWLVGNFGGRAGFFGISVDASGAPGGGSPPAPPFPLFGGTGIGSGFTLDTIPPLPEPSVTSLIAVGAGVILFWRGKLRRSNQPPNTE
jgi:hypothetical protein